MASYLILGAGKFGRLALNRLTRQDAAASFVVVDRDPAAIEEMRVNGVPGTRVQSEAAAFLAQHLKDDGRWDWIIPMAPVHVAFQWLMAGPLAGSAWQPAAAPEALMGLIPGSQRGSQGELYLSRARHRCPDDCAEPEVCPVTGESRDLPLHQELAALHLAGYEIRVIASRQLAPGVGGYSPRQMLDLARDMGAFPGNVLIATACRCHGVIQGLAQRSGEKRV
jgi:TrkA-N domain